MVPVVYSTVCRSNPEPLKRIRFKTKRRTAQCGMADKRLEDRLLESGLEGAGCFNWILSTGYYLLDISSNN